MQKVLILRRKQLPVLIAKKRGLPIQSHVLFLKPDVFVFDGKGLEIKHRTLTIKKNPIYLEEGNLSKGHHLNMCLQD